MEKPDPNDQTIVLRTSTPLRAIDIARIKALKIKLSAGKNIVPNQTEVIWQALDDSCQLRGIEPQAEPGEVAR
jgi:hypothetical protein